jgi:hemolysin activation/secretion protein
LITDNQGRPGSGTYRWGTEIVNQNVFGVGDTLTTRYVGSLGSVLARATYDTMPLNARGGKFSLTYHFQRTDYDTSILELPRDPDAVSFANFFIVSYLQPIDKKRRFTAFGGFRYVPYDTRIDGIQKYNKNYYITDAGLQMVTNDRLGKTHAEINSFLGFSDDHTRETFWRQRFAFNRTFNLPKSNTLVVKGLAQYSHDFLPIGLDIVLGGAYSVRGYSEGLINSERGYTLSVEHHWPVPYLKKIAPKLAKNVRGVTFADWGHAWLDPSNPRFIRGQSNDSDATTLASVGIGFRARLSRFCQGFVDIGYGLFDRSSWELLQQPTVRAHFGIRSDMFQQAPGYVEHANRPPHMIFSKATASAESDKD